jgi:eukaryotic-like serine/threonine-protein kinase
MNTDRWRQLDQVFVEALQLPREARAGFVERTCGEDEALRTEALSLLVADGASGEFLTKPALDRLAEGVAADGRTLRAGDRLGVYTVVQLLGSGGFGEVWRARDERLDRDVAIKILRPLFSTDTERVRRFADEARAAGGLNHSNILTVHDVGEYQGVPYLVSECLEGMSLRQRLECGPLKSSEVVAVALGVARGLSAAHGRGIVHRDLKPENVFLRSDGVPRILDFGLAKLQLPIDDQTTTSQTMTGVIAGTAGYMAPEQVKGENVDGRADLFALGVMLYEMLGGRHPFKGANTFETLHAIVTIDPPAVSSLNGDVSLALAQIVTRLLKKDRNTRFQSAGDLAWALEQVGQHRDDQGRPFQPQAEMAAWRRRWLTGVAAALVSVAVLVGMWKVLPTSRVELSPIPLTQFVWTLPAGLSLDSPPVVAPDGQSIVFIGRDQTTSRLFVRSLGSLEPRAIAGSERAKQPFWSPDSRWVGFFARGRLMKVAVAGGAPVPIADAPDARGGAWSPNGTIVFSPDLVLSALVRVSADGGPVEPVTLLDQSKGDNSHRWPVFLPDGVHFLYFNRSSVDERRGVYIGRLDRPASAADSLVMQSESEAVYAGEPHSAEGNLFVVANGGIEVHRFDTTRMSVTGEARTLGFKSAGNTPYHPMMLTVSTNLLAFAASSVPYGLGLESIDRTGKGERVLDETQAQNWPRVSPDGRRLARQRIDAVRGNPDIWVEDLDRRNRVRITTTPEPDMLPVWSPDGTRLAFVSGTPPGRTGTRVLTIANADGSGVVRSFPCPRECYPTDWTSDGIDLIVNIPDAKGTHVWAIPASGAGGARPVLNAPFTERDARISPDRRWIAYVSEESGRPEVSVRSLSGPAKRAVVSTSGGDQPVWAHDGSELFFVNPEGRLHSVRVAHGDATTFGLAVELNVPSIGFGHWGTQYDVSPDGGRIYFLRHDKQDAPREFTVVIGWRSLRE